MKIKSLSFVAIITTALLAAMSQSADRVWTGAGSDDNWSSADNWGGTAPIAGDTLFFAGSQRLSNNNDLPEGTAFAGINFNADAGLFVLGGNRITLNGPVTNLSATAKTFNLPIELNTDCAFYAEHTSYDINGHLSGSGGLIANATNSFVKLTASNSYDGVTIVTNGILQAHNDWALGSTVGNTIVRGKSLGRLELHGGIEIHEDLILNGQGMPGYKSTLACGTGSNTIWGAVHKMNEARILGASGRTLVFSGGVTGSDKGDLVLNPGGGTFIFNTKPLDIDGSFYQDQVGTVIVDVAGNSWNATVAAGGVMRCNVAEALPPTKQLNIGAGHRPDGEFNLNGFDQETIQLNTPNTTADIRTLSSTTPATLTLNQSVNTTFSGLLAGQVSLTKDNSGTITFTGKLSTTTGDITLNAGSIVVDTDAGFTASANINVNGGIMELRAATALPADGNLKIVDSGKIRISSGITTSVTCLFIDGVQQPRGTYGATGSGALHINDTYFDGTGIVNVKDNPPVTPAAYIWDDGGTDNNITTADNWDGDIAPQFDGTAALVFATAGSEANLTNLVDIYGLTFNAGSNFRITGTGIELSNGQGGIAAAAPDATARIYYVDSDVTLSDHQIWHVDSSNGATTLEVSGSISDNPLLPCNLVKSGSGALKLYGASTFNGDLNVEKGYLHVFHNDALGSTAGITRVYGSNDSRLYLNNGLNIAEPLYLKGEYNNGGTLFSYSGSNTLSGPMTVAEQVRFKIGAGSTLVISGGVIEEANNLALFVLNAESNSTIYFRDNPLLINAKVFYADAGGTTVLDVSGNEWDATLVANGRLRCDRANVMPPNANMRIGINYGLKGTFDLNGFDQQIGYLYENCTNVMSCVITSDTPATLTVNQSANQTIGYRLTGAVSLIKSGESTLNMTNLCSSTGSVTVNDGTLRIGGVGTLGPDCTSIMLEDNGILRLDNSSAITPTAVITMPPDGEENVKLHLSDGVEAVALELHYGTKIQRAGTWGSSSSTAKYKDDTRFSGTGILRVRRDNSGTAIIIR